MEEIFTVNIYSISPDLNMVIAHIWTYLDNCCPVKLQTITSSERLNPCCIFLWAMFSMEAATLIGWNKNSGWWSASKQLFRQCVGEHGTCEGSEVPGTAVPSKSSLPCRMFPSMYFVLCELPVLGSSLHPCRRILGFPHLPFPKMCSFQVLHWALGVKKILSKQKSERNFLFT